MERTGGSALQVGIIGLGMGAHHAAAYDRHPDCEVAALCDLSEQKLAELAERYPAARTTREAADLLDDPALDVVSVASYDDGHADQVLGALRAGKHVFVEKPLCHHEREARAIRQALRERPELRLSSNLILRRCPRFRMLREIISGGELGELYYVEGDYLYGRPQKLTDGWRGQREFYSLVHGGAVHMVDLLLWLTGARAVEVTALGNRIALRDTPYRFDDFVAALVRFEGGMIGKISVNGACMRPHFHALNLYGTAATFVNERESGRLISSRDRDGQDRLIDAPYPGYEKGDLIRSFVDSIVSGGEAEVSAEDVFRVASVCLAIERATRARGSVAVEYV